MLAFLAAIKPVLMVVVCCCGAVNNFYQYRHTKDGRASAGDYGYFWRLYKEGDRDGTVVIVCSAVAIVCGILALVGMFGV